MRYIFAHGVTLINHAIKQVVKNATLGDGGALLYTADRAVLGLTFCRKAWWKGNGSPCWWRCLLVPASLFSQCCVEMCSLGALMEVTFGVVLCCVRPRSSSQLTVEKQNDVVSSISPSAPEPLKQQWLTGLLQSFYVVTRTVSIFCHFFALAMIMLLPQKCICFKGNNTD